MLTWRLLTSRNGSPAQPDVRSSSRQPAAAASPSSIAGCGAAKPPRTQSDPARLGELHVVALERLRVRPAAEGAEHEAIRGHVGDLDHTPRSDRQRGHEDLEDQPAAGGDDRGDTFEARSLRRLLGQEAEGVERGEDQPERGSVDGQVEGGEVAEEPPHPVAAGLGRHQVEHRRRGVDTPHLDAALGDRDGQPAGADAELEGRLLGRGGDEVVDRGGSVFGQRVPLVVDVGVAVAVALGSVTVDPVDRTAPSLAV